MSRKEFGIIMAKKFKLFSKFLNNFFSRIQLVGINLALFLNFLSLKIYKDFCLRISYLYMAFTFFEAVLVLEQFGGLQNT